MDSGIVSNWSKAPPPVPWVIISITLFSLIGMLIYSLISPMQQQAMIDIAGAVPSDTAAMLKQAPGNWHQYGLLALFSNLFVHASWLHLIGNLTYLWVFGAVSAVVGAYLGLFPSKRIGLFLPLGLYLQFAHVPALLVIGSWFTLQLVYSAFGPITGGVAFWTHLAGFVLGLIFAMLARALAQLRF
jgi:membrane associated rhomboid family serine protease